MEDACDPRGAVTGLLAHEGSNLLVLGPSAALTAPVASKAYDKLGIAICDRTETPYLFPEPRLAAPVVKPAHYINL